MGIEIEFSCEFTIVHLCVLLFKGPTHLPCQFYFALVLLCFALLCLLYFDPTPFCFALPCLPALGHACPTFGHACPTLGCVFSTYPWVPLVTFHIGQIKYYRSKVIAKGAATRVVPFANELVRHEKVVLVSNSLCPTTLKHQNVALPFFHSYLLQLCSSLSSHPPSLLLFSSICH